MTTAKTLERSILKLPLSAREALLAAIQKNIEAEYDRLAAASIAADMRMIEQVFSKYPLSDEQVDILEFPVDAADSEADVSPWERVRQEIFAELHRSN